MQKKCLKKKVIIKSKPRIFQKVNIAEGILFNYFSSKGELFVATVFGNFDTKRYELRRIEDINEDTIVNEILNLIDFYIRRMASLNKYLLRYFSVIFNINNTESLVTRKSLFHMDEMVMEELKQLFDELKEKHEDYNA